MTNPMTCEQFADRLSDLLERDVDEPTRASLESHALGCEDCGPLLADLRNLRIDAANLPELTPSRDLWSGIESRIATPVIELQSSGPVSRGEGRPLRPIERNRRWSRLMISLAAAGLVIATAGITHVMTKRAYVSTAVGPLASNTVAAPVKPVATKPDSVSTPPAPIVAVADPARAAAQAPAPAPANVQQVSNPKDVSPEATYAREISRLNAVMKARRAQLDPQTVGVIEMNLRVIDDAIAQCKQALLKDPASRYLMQSLNSELENKVELLRRAALLPLRTS